MIPAEVILVALAEAHRWNINGVARFLDSHRDPVHQRLCRLGIDVRAERRAAMSVKTHCVNGHEYAVVNKPHRRNERVCRICANASLRRHYAMKKALASGTQPDKL